MIRVEFNAYDIREYHGTGFELLENGTVVIVRAERLKPTETVVTIGAGQWKTIEVVE
ncbi:hypothetical protein RHODO2019_11050 [Rhodococcus antarcticus]|uniref:Uncharacterized protein n=1 Tax=Rhodococcus antarcticus TaxID=2987751 RepID=A0ABY6NXN9_9NOCA|nr:hypothetical protein [Rhodococcus antarcticus]UZJ23743.1 hypothetical protein RHODO2019_11050 [Rhodococcus antarcticus]